MFFLRSSKLASCLWDHFSFLTGLQWDQKVLHAASSGRMLISADRFVCGGVFKWLICHFTSRLFLGCHPSMRGRAVIADLLTCSCSTLLLISPGTVQKLLFTLYKFKSTFQFKFNSSLYCCCFWKKRAEHLFTAKQLFDEMGGSNYFIT